MQSFRIQLTLLMLIAVFAPATVFITNVPGGRIPVGVWYGLLGSTAAVFVGLLTFRRFIDFPGIRAFGYILPTFGATYAMAIAALLFSRAHYSSVYLGLSFAAALVTMFLMVYWIERRGLRRFYVAPFGRTGLIDEIGDVEWVVLDKPEVPPDPEAAIVADLHYDHAPEWERMFAEAALAGHPVYHTKQLRESLTGRVTIEHLSENSFGSLLPNLAYRKVKRAADLVLCLALSPILVLAGLLIGVVIRLDSPGPAFFRQERLGYRGRRFTMVKFRTMRCRPARADEETARSDEMTQTDDQRITRIGRFLRRTRLDEVPQVINVVRGEMSLIGPRPEAMSLSRWYSAELPFYGYRHIVRPGITGWAQVQQGHVTDLESINEKLSYDFYYIRSFSAWLDIVIALRTVAVMLSGFGSK